MPRFVRPPGSPSWMLLTIATPLRQQHLHTVFEILVHSLRFLSAIHRPKFTAVSRVTIVTSHISQYAITA